MTRFVRGLAILTATLAAALLAGPATADTLHLKDGRTLDGEVTREGDSFIYFAYKIGDLERVEIFLRADIDRIERDEKPPAPADEDAEADEVDARPGRLGRESARPAPSEAAPGATRIAFITLEGTVGHQMYADALGESVKLLEDDKPDIVVLRFDSGGGIGAEVKPLSDVIQRQIKPKYRVVAWIDSAISAAAMTAITCEEIYFRQQGNFGAATGYRALQSGLKAIEGEELEEMLRMMERISKRGNHDPLIMRAMQAPTDLSCDIDENGRVTWRNDLQGEYVLSTAANERILKFNSIEAIKYNFAKGVADDREELAQAMGVSEWVEVGEDANDYQENFREDVGEAMVRATELLGKMNVAMESGQWARARRYLGQLRGWVRRAPPLAKYGDGQSFGPLSDEFFRQMEERIREASREDRRRD